MDLEKLQRRFSKLQEKAGGGKNIWFKAGEEKQTIRQVPYPHGDVGPFIEVYFHYNVAGNRSLVCPKETHGEPCPICELADEIRQQGTTDSWKIYKQYAPKLRAYSPVLVRGKEEEGVKLWGYGVTIYESLMEKYFDEDWGNLSDPKTGRDLTVWSIPKNSAGNDSDYIKPKLDVKPSQTAMLKKKADIVKILEEMPDYLNDGETFAVKSYQELEDIIRQLDSSEDDYEDSESETSYSASDDTDDSSDDTDLNAKLNKLLGDG